MDTLLQDLRYGVRRIVRNPGFSLVAVLTLALGIGANTTIFTMVNALLLRPADAARPAEIVRVYVGHHGGLQHSELDFLRRYARSFTGVIGEKHEPLAFGRTEGSEQVNGVLVTGNFFTLLGIPAAAGRVFTAADDSVPGGSPVVVLGHRFWTRRLAADPGVVGGTVKLNGREYTVAGIAREGFTGPFVGPVPDLWVPMAESLPLTGRRPDEIGSIYTAARLAPGVSLEQGEAELRVLAERMWRLDPARAERPTALRLDRSRGINAELRMPAAIGSALLLAVVGMVLLTACANLASLLLSRALARRREMGIRAAIGASRRRLLRQLLTESVLLALLGGVGALLVANWSGVLLLSLLPEDVAVIAPDLSIDRRVLLFTLAVSLGAGMLFGLAPALRASSPDVLSALKDVGAYRRSRLRSAFVVAQVALSMILLASAALFLRSLAESSGADPGFDPSGVLDVPLNLDLRRYDETTGPLFYQRLVAELERLPGVRSVSLARVVPLGGSNIETSFLLQEDAPDARRMTYLNTVGTRYFETLRIPLVRGREFTDADRAGAAPVVVVNEAFARANWPEGDALGRRLTTGDASGPFATVVGVVRDAKYVSRGEAPRPTLYFPFAQNYGGEATVHVRTDGDPAALVRPVAERVEALDPLLPFTGARPMAADMELSLLPARFGAWLLGVFGGLALLLASVGIYGVVTYAVAQRTREIAIRAALGARRGPLLRLVVADSMRWTAIGVAIGLPVALLVGRLARGLLYGVGAADPAVLLGAPLLLVALTALASFIPARRATRVDPMVALRTE